MPQDELTYIARRAVVAFVVSALAGALVWWVAVDDAEGAGAVRTSPDGGAAAAAGAAATTSTTTAAPTTTAAATPPDDGKTAAQRRLEPVARITDGPLRPKSVVALGDGRFIAQNMMYAHSVTVYDRTFSLVERLDDRVPGSLLGLPGDSYQGAPVESAVSPDGKVAWISNYQMYGDGFDKPGDDKCAKDGGWDDSYLYRLDLATLTFDAAVKVGPVPKYVAVTPDSKTVLVTNWCGYDLSIVEAATLTETKRIPIGRFPRGIAVTPDGTTAYVAVMGGSDIAVVDLARQEVVDWIKGVGRGPRHLVLSPDGATLYATLNSADEVIKIDPAARKVVGRSTTRTAPRSMAISDDGTALYVVAYESDQVAKIDTATMSEVQRLDVAHHPIGIAYDPGTRQVWVACYVGELRVLQDA